MVDRHGCVLTCGDRTGQKFGEAHNLFCSISLARWTRGTDRIFAQSGVLVRHLVGFLCWNLIVTIDARLSGADGSDGHPCFRMNGLAVIHRLSALPLLINFKVDD